MGCVLCSPGCFSLFRAKAIMDDNVLKTYTTVATEALQYIQYDQGEDRWLCTVMLQQGWRVEYCTGSDAYTNAPQEFKEFFNQRRRWGPSTMANTFSILENGVRTAKKNPSISRLYILYQIIEPDPDACIFGVRMSLLVVVLIFIRVLRFFSLHLESKSRVEYLAAINFYVISHFVQL
ncbi:chitin synthase chs-1-like [Petromyzon marinus]